MQPSGGGGAGGERDKTEGVHDGGGGGLMDDGMDGWINITKYKIAPPETPNRKYSDHIFFFIKIIMENDGKGGVLLYLKPAQFCRD